MVDIFKLAAYPHLYSFTSTKSVVHWFQIIRNKSFQMYDDDVQAPLSIGASDRYYRAAKFPTRNIKTPIVLVYGGSDSLVDIDVMLKELPRHTVAKEVPHFEHLDFLWAQEVDTLVFPHVFDALAAYAGRDHLKSIEITHQPSRFGRLALTDNSSYSEDDIPSPSTGELSDRESRTARNAVKLAKISANRFSPGLSRHRRRASPPSSASTEPTSLSMDGSGEKSDAALLANPVSQKSNSIKHIRRRSGSISSARSLDGSKRFSDGGISIGAAKPMTGVSKASLPYSIGDGGVAGTKW